MDQFDLDKDVDCLVYDRYSNARFEEFDFPVVTDEDSYRRCLSIYDPSVVVVNSCGLEASDVAALIESDKEDDGVIVFVLLSDEDGERCEDVDSIRTLHEALTAVRKLKADCSNNILKFSIEYSIKWGPSGFLKKGRIVDGRNDFWDMSGCLFDDEKRFLFEGAQKEHVNKAASWRFASGLLMAAAIGFFVALSMAEVDGKSSGLASVDDHAGGVVSDVEMRVDVTAVEEEKVFGAEQVYADGGVDVDSSKKMNVDDNPDIAERSVIELKNEDLKVKKTGETKGEMAVIQSSKDAVKASSSSEKARVVEAGKPKEVVAVAKLENLSKSSNQSGVSKKANQSKKTRSSSQEIAKRRARKDLKQLKSLKLIDPKKEMRAKMKANKVEQGVQVGKVGSSDQSKSKKPIYYQPYKYTMQIKE